MTEMDETGVLPPAIAAPISLGIPRTIHAHSLRYNSAPDLDWQHFANVLISALNVKVNEIQTSADPVVFWLRARHLCFLGGRALQSGELMGLLKLLEGCVPAALANSLKADEEDRRSDHARRRSSRVRRPPRRTSGGVTSVSRWTHFQRFKHASLQL